MLRRSILPFFLFLVAATASPAQDLTTPTEFLGFGIGDDYQLATYEQLYDFWQVLAEQSPRMMVEDIGRTEEGRPHVMATITSPENHVRLDHYREIARRLALAEGLSDREAWELAAEGRAVVWIDGGLHASEVLGAQQLMELVWQLVSHDDPETLRFLDDVIILAAHANPDGHSLYANWYMRNEDPEERTTSGVPVLYQKYTGHDNNRDFYMSTQSETINMNRILYREWFPQIVYNHHQTGPRGTVMFAPPFRDPFNYNYHPLMPLSIEAVGTAMHSRFVREGKGGTTMRSGASYSTWWNGGLRTTPYFHNQIGLLTETIGHPTPMEIPLVLDRQLPRNDIPLPVEPQKWHFRQSVDYSMTANRAVLNYASRNRHDLLYNIYVMGRDNIAKGQQDTWRTDPSVIQAADLLSREQEDLEDREVFEAAFRAPKSRDPRGYIIPADQRDFPTATKFVNTLIKNGVTVHRASRAFTVGGAAYPEGSYMVSTAQAFRPFVLDMFEPQVHPNDFAYPGGPPISPYDNTGWTVALQMGVEFDRMLDGFDGPFERIDGFAAPEGGMVSSPRRARGFLFSHEVNDSFVAMNRLLRAGHEVYWLSEPMSAGEMEWPAGSMYVTNAGGAGDLVARYAAELGVSFHGTRTRPGSNALRMSTARVGLWDRYGGSMDAGWARWILEQFEFDHELVFPKRLDEGDLIEDFDVLVFVGGAIPGQGGGRRGFGQRDEESIPEEYRDRLGSVTAETTIPAIEAFLNAGGSVVAIGSSTNLAAHLDLGLEDWLLDYEDRALTRSDYFIPGSIVRVSLDNTRPIAWGMPAQANVHFNNSPVFELTSQARTAGVSSLAWFDEREPLLSGWAWGQHYLMGGTTMAEVSVGDGQLYLFGPEILRRAQPHGSFKLLFNGIALSSAR